MLLKKFIERFKNQNNSQNLLGIIAKRQSQFISFINDILPNPDAILKKNNETLETYRNFLYDAHVASCVQSRKSGVLSLKYEINRGGQKNQYSEFIEKIFNKLNLRNIISEMLDAPLFGYKPMEIYWGIENGYIVPVDVVGKPPWWFEFDKDNLLRFKSVSKNKSIIVPRYKFLILQHNATYENPYGEAVLAKCYYPVIFKKGGMKLWSVFIQKYGMPFLHGKIGLGRTQDDAYELLSVLEKLQQDGVAITDDDTNIEVLDVNKSASADIYKNLLHFCNAEISKAILSQTLTTEQGDTGSYAMSQTHLQVRKDVVDADKHLVEYWLNKLIEWTININFENVNEYPRFVFYEEGDVDLNLAQRDKLLADIGVKFTTNYFKRQYGLKDDEFTIDTNIETEFAETIENDDTEPLYDSNFEKIGKEVVNFVLEHVKKANSYEEIEEKLIELYPSIPTAELEKYIAQALVIATSTGMLNAR